MNSTINLFQPGVAFHIETSHIETNHYMERNIGQKWVKDVIDENIKSKLDSNSCCSIKARGELVNSGEDDSIFGWFIENYIEFVNYAGKKKFFLAKNEKMRERG